MEDMGGDVGLEGGMGVRREYDIFASYLAPLHTSACPGAPSGQGLLLALSHYIQGPTFARSAAQDSTAALQVCTLTDSSFCCSFSWTSYALVSLGFAVLLFTWHLSLGRVLNVQRVVVPSWIVQYPW